MFQDGMAHYERHCAQPRGYLLAAGMPGTAGGGAATMEPDPYDPMMYVDASRDARRDNHSYSSGALRGAPPDGTGGAR
jgi:hypothetical protein